MTRDRLTPSVQTASARAAVRVPIAFAPLAVFLLGAGLLWVIAAFIDWRALVAMIVWDVLVLAAVALDLRRLPQPPLIEITRRWSGVLTLGRSTAVSLSVRNSGSLPLEVHVTDHSSEVLCEEHEEMRLRVPAKGEAQASYPIEPRERGDVRIGVVAVRWRSDWGLAERWAIAPLEQTVRVYPDLHEGRRESLYLVRSRQVALEKRRARRVGAGREFEHLRDYQPGDERRDVSWMASARRGKLVTRIYRPERSQAVWILLDAGRLQRARAGRRSMLDYTVMGALGLSQVALAAGDRVGLLTYGRRVQRRLAPGRGATHLRDLVDALAIVRADAAEADHATAAAEVLSVQKRRALMIWLTDVAETAGVPDVIEQATAMASRHVVLFAVLRHPDTQALMTSTPQNVRQMYRLMAAQEALERRAVLLHGLRQRGALVIETAPSELSTTLVDRYLEVKERGAL